jgi:ubiquinone/menaquinone biosynthesis C-methylase UbiE
MIEETNSFTNPLLEDLWAFTKTETVLTAFELGLFQVLLPSSHQSVDVLAKKLQIDPSALKRLLQLLQTWGYVSLQADDTVMPSPQTMALFPTVESQSSWLAYATYIRQVQAAWRDLGATFKQGTPTGAAFSLGEAEARFSNLNEGLGLLHAPLADALFTALLPYLPCVESNQTAVHCLDVGAGSGVWSIPFLRAFDQAAVTFLDYPSVLAQAEASTVLAPFKSRMRLVACDFESTNLEWQPNAIAPATVVMIANVLKELSHEARINLLEKAWQQLAKGGVMVIVETLNEPTQGGLPLVSTVANLHLLATSMSSTGCFTAESLSHLCETVLFKKSGGGIDLTWLAIEPLKLQGLSAMVIQK